MMSWEVRFALTLVRAGVAVGVLLLVLAFGVLSMDPGFLFAILPIVSMVLFGAGAFITCASLALSSRLAKRRAGARLQVAALGGCLVFSGTMTIVASAVAGFGLVLYGGALMWLMSTPAAARDLGSWRRQFQQGPAPWGSTPGTAVWSPEPQQQGPWSPDPTTVPWMSWKNSSGPRPPWWQTWQAGLAQGIPLWELIVVCSSLLLFAFGLIGSWVPALRVVGLVALLLSFGGVWLMEQRMRQRLARR